MIFLSQISKSLQLNVQSSHNEVCDHRKEELGVTYLTGVIFAYITPSGIAYKLLNGGCGEFLQNYGGKTNTNGLIAFIRFRIWCCTVGKIWRKQMLEFVVVLLEIICATAVSQYVLKVFFSEPVHSL
jgi:hypothetical protein